MSYIKAFREVVDSFNGNFTVDDLKIELFRRAEWADDRREQRFKEYLYDQAIYNPNGYIEYVVGTTNTLTKNLSARTVRPTVRRTSATLYQRVIKYPNPLTPDSKQVTALKTNGVTFDENNLIELTKDNSIIIEPLIISGIPASGSRRYVPIAKREYDSHCVGGSFDFSNLDSVMAVVKQIDKENGTLDAFSHKSSAIAFYSNYIVNHVDFERKLDSSSIPEIKSLVDDMYNEFRTSPNGYNAKSLASKVCKYLHEFRYGHEKFYINDSVVRSILPYYLNKYHHTIPTNMESLTYSELFDLLSFINSKCPTLTKTELDHLLWFTYKAWNKI